MSNKHYILAILAILLTGSCSEELINVVTPDGEAVELRGVEAEIVSGTGVTRANGVEYLKDSISRYQFEHNDKMVFTQIHRTSYPLVSFKYKDIAFDCNESGAWQRDKTTGEAGEGDSKVEHPERIYWSDASSPHTFIGYSKPRDNSSFDWKKSSYCYDMDGTKSEFNTYYGAIGDPTNASETINYNITNTETITQVVNKVTTTKEFKYSPVLRNEDLLLTYDDNLVADNSVANIKFHHALSSVRVIVNISGFYGTASDAYSVVSDMKLLAQPTMYRWKQVSYKAEPLINSNENTTLQQDGMWGTGAPAYNQRKDMILWNAEPNGVGEGSSKTFTFYGITVPQEADFFSATENSNKGLKLQFMVTYPDPLKNDPVNHKISKWYNAEIPVNTSATDPSKKGYVYFHPGQCTTIKVTLNHRDESMTIGASYLDWEYVETPDEGSLKKKSTFLQKAPAFANRAEAKVTIAGDQGATVDDATWLYISKTADNTETLLDIYGNDGSISKPFTISTADQLLSFSYEVESGRDFEHTYVKLDADITLQPQTSLPTKTENDVTVIDYDKLVKWKGVGSSSKPFKGIFLGNGRYINSLYGDHFFHTVGETAVIDRLNFNNVIEVQGCGVIAHENKGLICSCYIEGDVKETATEGTQYTGSIVGINNSFIIACSHVGKVTGFGKVGGLVGFNNGTVMASYHSGVVESEAGGEAHPSVGDYGDGTAKDGTTTNKSIMFSCYYDRDVFKDSRQLVPSKLGYPLPTSMLQGSTFVDSKDKLFVFNDTDGSYTIENKTLKDVLLLILKKRRADDVDYDSKTVDELMDILVAEGLTGRVNEVFGYHFSLNGALEAFRCWLNAIAKKGDATVTTNCHVFTKEQVLFLQTHYHGQHIFKYVPATYPKTQ